MNVLESGVGEFRFTDPDELRAWMRDEKRREFVDKTTTEQEAVSRFVKDGDYISFDFSSFTRGPLSLIREIIRQRKRDLWYSAKFTLMESTLLVGAGLCSRIDVGFMGLGETLNRAVETGAVKVTEWTNGTLTLRHLAGAMGLPFLPTRALLGSDTLKYSGAKVVGPGVSPLETATASKRVIISTDEIIDHEEIRKDPGRTTIPYYLVDAVVFAPFGAYPGGTPGLYEIDYEHYAEYSALERQGKITEYLEKYAWSVSSHEEMLEKRVGLARLNAMKRRATIKEGYR